MASPERFNQENQDHLWDLRTQIDEQVGKPHGLEAKIVAITYKYFIEKAMFDPLFSDKLRLRKHLTRLKELYKNNPYSRLFVSVFQIDYAKQAILAEAETALSETQNYPFKFAVLFDTAYGMGLLAESAIIAQKHLQNPLENPLSDVVDTAAERLDLPTSEYAQIFLNTRQLSSYLAQLLEKDPSGQSLMKDIIRFLKDPKYGKRTAGINDMVVPYTVRRFVVVGAETGEELHKKLYPLTKNLSSQ